MMRLRKKRETGVERTGDRRTVMNADEERPGIEPMFGRGANKSTIVGVESRTRNQLDMVMTR